MTVKSYPVQRHVPVTFNMEVPPPPPRELPPPWSVQHVMGKHIRGENVRAPRLISNGWVAGAVWERCGNEDGRTFSR